MKPYDVFKELKHQNDILVFKKLIASAPLRDPENTNTIEWQMVLAYLLKIVSDNTELGNERVLLACTAFYAVLPTQYNSNHFRDVIVTFQKLKTNYKVCLLDKSFDIANIELFKLVNVYGYLQLNEKDVLDTHYEYIVFSALFEVIYKHCITYTKYSYFAYKVLSMWLKRLKNISDECFWNDHNCILERRLEAIIFSNWSNALNITCKQNVEIFNTYLRIMSQKYNETFIDHVYRMCLKNMSWQNETKYVILTEIVQVHDMGIQTLIEKGFLFDLCISLTKNSLLCGSTKLYLAILRKLSETEWKRMFEDVLRFVIYRWESGKHENHNALQSLFKYWLEPTIEMYKNVLLFLWELCKELKGYFCRSHLLRIAAKKNELLQMLGEKLDCYTIIADFATDNEEIVRLNAFVAFCYHAPVLIDSERVDPFLLIKRFLWFNANTATILMREGIIKHFRTMCAYILKMNSNKGRCMQSVFEFMKWLYEYLLDCLEIDSCYQRKILALNLYEILLFFTNKNLLKNLTIQGDLCYHLIMDNNLKPINGKFINKKSLFTLLKLVLDSALDVRQLAGKLILSYFEKNALSTEEKQILYGCAWEHCNSFKFYEIESGATLLKIIAQWMPFNEVFEDTAALDSDKHNSELAYSSYSEFLLNAAKVQLTEMKTDILKAIVENKPFYGVLTALLEVAFRNGPENSILKPKFMDELLYLLTDAVDFFLSSFSTKTSSKVSSSSFAEMGLAIDKRIKTSEIEDFDYDDLQLSPVHQILISCIWMSLKILCEIASEIGMLMQSNEQVKHAMHIIVTVLRKCRHKGVVECAGVAIANLSKRLYNSKEYFELPKEHLIHLLEDDEKSMALTRRGAGLSIMFHKLTVSDNRKNRPTVHFALKVLLNSLNNVSLTTVANVKAGEDSPWTKRLYFLRALVLDKEIHAHLVSYMEDICLMCFRYMESEIWIIRNASLQLYGAMVPRLVGQSTNKGDEALDFGDGYSVNSFVTHYPKLTSHMWARLRAVSKIRGTSSEALRSYAGVMSTLMLLSKLSTSGCDLVDYPAKAFITEIRRLLLAFLGNPMMHVRQLAAKAYAAFTPWNGIYPEMDVIRNKILSSKVNMSHGCLLTYRYLKEKYIYETCTVYSNEEMRNSAEISWAENEKFGYSRYQDILRIWNSMGRHEKATQPCYIVETLLQREFNYTRFAQRYAVSEDLLIIPEILSTQKIQPGFFQLVEQWQRLHAEHIKVCIIKESYKLDSQKHIWISRILNSICIEQSIGFLQGLSHCVPLLEFMLKYLISIKDDHHQLLYDEIVAFTLRTIRQVDLTDNKVEFEKIIEEFDKVDISVAKSSVTHVKNSLILAFSNCEQLINRVLMYIYGMCTHPEQSMRLMAVEYIEFVMCRFRALKDNNKLLIKKCCLFLLKDEITEVRKIVLKSLNAAPVLQDFVLCQTKHEELWYQQLLFNVIRHQNATENEEFVCYFTLFLSHALGQCGSIKIENPFHHNNSIFYKEESKFLNLCFLYQPLSNNRDICEDLVIYAIQTKRFRKFHEKAGFNYGDLRKILNLKEIDYMAQKRQIVIDQWC